MAAILSISRKCKINQSARAPGQNQWQVVLWVGVFEIQRERVISSQINYIAIFDLIKGIVFFLQSK